MAVIPVTVTRIADEAAGIRSFELASSATSLPSYEPGAHVEIHIEDGQARCYSLCGDRPDRYLIAVKRESRPNGVSRHLHDYIKLGDTLHLSPPRNAFPLDEGASASLLIAGGIGITPLLAMADRLSAKQRKFRLHYFARSPAHAAFLSRLGANGLRDSTRLHFGLTPSDSLATLAECIRHADPHARVYVCGPEPLIDAVRFRVERERSDLALRFERFSPASPAEPNENQEFDVILRSGQRLSIPSEKTLLEVLEEAGVAPKATCRLGVCGTCVVGVLDGIPDHRDDVLTDEERAANDAMCVCVSRARSRTITLDL